MRFAIWSEGFIATGEHGTATYHGESVGKTFEEAVKKYAQFNPDFNKFFDSERMSYWGCRLFPYESEARKSYG